MTNVIAGSVIIYCFLVCADCYDTQEVTANLAWPSGEKLQGWCSVYDHLREGCEAGDLGRSVSLTGQQHCLKMS
jgi:hypothetical protein